MKKILIIEDDLIVANIYRNKLSLEGFQVDTASDGEAGLERLRKSPPDAVILDLMMPRMNGVDFLKQMRAESAFSQLPVIVFSNTYLANMVQQAWKAGATKCLSKASCSPKQLIEIVRGTLHVNGSGHVGSDTAAPPPANGSAAPNQPVAEPPAPAAPVKPDQRITSQNEDAEFEADLRASFLEGLPAVLVGIRSLLQTMIKADNEIARLKQVHEMYRRMHALTGNASLAGMTQIAQMADALEALLKELYEKPQNINASTLRTVASAVDFIAFLSERSVLSGKRENPPATILVVDDEAISCQAVTHSLEKARLKSVAVDDPQVAFNLLKENRFDLVFLDVDMPGMSGFELCARLRNLPDHKKTPVVFVTALSDFENRANSLVSGGNDLIAKPFLFIELTVKALVYVMRRRLDESVAGPAFA